MRRGARYGWAQRGDINAFFGLMLDNIGVMILMGSLLVAAFKMPRTFVLTRMIPGTAVGVLGRRPDLHVHGVSAGAADRPDRRHRHAAGARHAEHVRHGLSDHRSSVIRRRLQRGLDTEIAARHAWFLGITMLLASGIFKLACAPFSGWIRKIVPRAGLLGSLAAIALVLISFLPFLDIAAHPVAGMVALGLILATLTARWQFPGQDSRGAGGGGDRLLDLLRAVCAGMGAGTGERGGRPECGVPGGLAVADPGLVRVVRANRGSDVIRYLPVAIPLALATVVGGIDCTESAAQRGR